MANPLKIVGANLTAVMRFRLHFNHMPDFATLNANGIQKDSFNFFLAFNPTTPNPGTPVTTDVIVRGDEIHLAQAIRIRDGRPPVADPAAGGWGAIRGTVPYRVLAQANGTAVLIFSVAFPLLGVTGSFAWLLETYNFARVVDSKQGVSP